MNKLIIDCSLGMSIFVCKDEEIFSKIDENEKKHTDELLASVDELLVAAGMKISDIDVIGVCVGPGSFTGVRVAISICKGLAVGTGAKVVAVSNFDAYLTDEKKTFIVLEGFSNFVYVRKNNGKKVEDSCVDIGEFASEIKDKYADAEVVVNNEKAQNLLKKYEIQANIGKKQTIDCVNQKIEQKQFIEINQISPIYLRASQAEIERNKKLGGRA